MWKVILYPIWKYEYVEKKLSEYEKDGLRLQKVFFCYLFYFCPSNPKETVYFFSYTLPKEWGMLEASYELSRYYGANIVNAKFSGIDIYRMINRGQNLAEFYQVRDFYLKHVLKVKLFLCTFFLMLFSLCALGAPSANLKWIFGITCLINITYVAYYIVGLLDLSKSKH